MRAGPPEVRGPGPISIQLKVNRAVRTLEVEPGTTLAQALRDGLGLTGTKMGCDRGACSACTVLLDGVPACELEKCEKRRGEVTDVFIENVPTCRLYPPVRYYLGRSHEASRSPAAAEWYRSYLALRRSDEGATAADSRRRLAALTATAGAPSQAEAAR